MFEIRDGRSEYPKLFPCSGSGTFTDPFLLDLKDAHIQSIILQHMGRSFATHLTHLNSLFRTVHKGNYESLLPARNYLRSAKYDKKDVGQRLHVSLGVKTTSATSDYPDANDGAQFLSSPVSTHSPSMLGDDMKPERSRLFTNASISQEESKTDALPRSHRGKSAPEEKDVLGLPKSKGVLTRVVSAPERKESKKVKEEATLTVPVSKKLNKSGRSLKERSLGIDPIPPVERVTRSRIYSAHSDMSTHSAITGELGFRGASAEYRRDEKMMSSEYRSFSIDEFRSLIEWQHRVKGKEDTGNVDFYHAFVSNPQPIHSTKGVRALVAAVLLQIILLAYFSAFMQYSLVCLARGIGYLPLFFFPFIPYVAFFTVFYGVSVSSSCFMRFGVKLLVYSLINHLLGFIIAIAAAGGSVVLIGISAGQIIFTCVCAECCRIYAASLDLYTDEEVQKRMIGYDRETSAAFTTSHKDVKNVVYPR
eukprot:CAMPEP_0167769394 /NCGR_PEP_ID=MMETSP0110_2-20121227/17278_1 /TAXON_ID=629695 /ORGANISM="Gymnochlora sp., Strain CCMP2014" /LENGTH=476 /DNA_ID=CAMNT_0007658333 /DNA_START=437 /DNA_END=1864 /DNA_ORIENTATION=-